MFVLKNYWYIFIIAFSNHICHTAVWGGCNTSQLCIQQQKVVRAITFSDFDAYTYFEHWNILTCSLIRHSLKTMSLMGTTIIICCQYLLPNFLYDELKPTVEKVKNVKNKVYTAFQYNYKNIYDSFCKNGELLS